MWYIKIPLMVLLAKLPLPVYINLVIMGIKEESYIKNTFEYF